jgi:hypothetical protein
MVAIAFLLVMTAFGVFLGVAMPMGNVASKPDRELPTVGRSGSAGHCFALVTANTISEAG